MPRTLAYIPDSQPIVDRIGNITTFFRFRWQQLIDGYAQSPTLAWLRKIGQSAALATTILWTTRTAAPYRITISLRITQAASTSSSAQVTITWVDGGLAQTKTFAAVTGNTTTTHDSQVYAFEADAATNITIAVAYGSVGVQPMIYKVTATVEQQV